MSAKTNKSIKNMVLCGIFTALIVIGTFIRIPIPAVPFTLQFLFTNLAGLVLGKKRGTLSVAIYILIGLIGFPVFATGGGLDYVLRPTFGYMIGFLFGTFVAGLISQKKKNTGNLILAGFVNMAIVYFVGIIYFYLITRYYMGESAGIGYILIYCFLITLPGDIISVIIGANITKHLSKISR